MTMVEHHIKYKEIHGVDETIWMERSEHRRLHERLRKEGKCLVPVKNLETIANKAYDRTDKARKKHKLYDSTNVSRIAFFNLIEKGAAFIETIRYNIITGHISVYIDLTNTKPKSGGRIRI